MLRSGFLFAVGIAIAVPTGGARAADETAIDSPSAAGSVAAFVAEAAQRFGIPERWIYAVMRVESAGYPRAISPKGAMGLMQLMPETWADLRARYGLGDDPFAPRDNILAGAAYLRQLYDHYGASGFLAAYNCGPARYERYLAGRASLPSETISYIARLTPLVAGVASNAPARAAPDPLAWRSAALFAARDSSRGGDGPPIASQPAVDAAVARPDAARRADNRPLDTLFILPSGKPAR